jgi:hypothetical protein
VAISPPLTISPDEIKMIADGVRAGLDTLVETGQVAIPQEAAP